MPWQTVFIDSFGKIQIFDVQRMEGVSPEPAFPLLAFHDNPTFRASVTSIPNTLFFPNAASLAKIFVACVAVISVSFKPSGKRDVQGGKERKIKRVGGRAGKRKRRFLSFPAPTPPPPLLLFCSF